MIRNRYFIGLDVGSTTIKIAVVHPESRQLLFSMYKRHNAEQAKVVLEMLETVHANYPEADFEVAVCGSGGKTIADTLRVPFVQEVVANSIAIRAFYKEVRTAIELGGQDAKVIFFKPEEKTKQLIASDMRMNGACAGGTGAFIDQVAEILNVKIEQFNRLAEAGRHLYDISGRCGVFAKTDIQPLLNQGVAQEDIALSTFHAIAKQTIGGLAQGMVFSPKVIFEGGPLTFNPKLIEVFKERLRLNSNDVIVPNRPEIIVAYGAALSIERLFEGKPCGYKNPESLQLLKNYLINLKAAREHDAELFFRNEDEKKAFFLRHISPGPSSSRAARGWTLEGDYNLNKSYFPGSKITAYLGIDAGSTTTKFVLLDEEGNVRDTYYSNNHGDPLKVIKYSLINMREHYRKNGVKLEIKGVGTTGYGEILFSKAFKADYHTVETVAHTEAAKRYAPDVSFILDIGGQDMKAISLKNGIVTGIVLNEACSAGCGSFIETYAKSLGVEVSKIAEMAFKSVNSSRLGSRCTVFMNSSIITEQKNGKTTQDILAGICRSIIENVFTKVVRISNLDLLGDVIVVQGGTFKNDAVLRAFEQYTGRHVIRPPFPGEMGAIGIALLTKKHIEATTSITDKPYTSSFIGLHALDSFDYEKIPGLACP
ncbi:MAG: acyl-CoA dehydratase activase, partial [Spirochaetota bacterium]